MQISSPIAQSNRHSRAIEPYEAGWSSLWGLLVRVSIAALQHPAPRYAQLDLDEMTDSLKRDLGFLDGRAPYREENLSR